MAGGGTPAHGWLQACEDPGHGLPQVPGCPSGASCVIRVSTWPGVLRPLRKAWLAGLPTHQGIHDSTREAGCRSRARSLPQRALCPGEEKAEGWAHRACDRHHEGSAWQARRDGGH